MTQADSILQIVAIRCFSTAIEAAANTPPADIQWMPPGRHTINASGPDDKPITLTLEVNEQLSRRVAAALQQLRGKAAAGEGDLPFIDFNHEDREASGHPTEVFWAGADKLTGGIRVRLDWTGDGSDSITRRTFRRFSPEFHLDPDLVKAAAAKNEVPTLRAEDIRIGVNLGGLVNRAAFKTIQPIWSREAASPGDPHTTKTKKTNMKTTEEQLADLTTAVAGLTGNLAAIQAKLNETPRPDAKIVALETQLSTVLEGQKVQAKENASGLVRKAVSEGKLPAQAVELHAKWVELICVDAKNADLLEKLAPNPVLLQVVQAGAGAGGTSTGNIGEHEFVVKAKEFGKSKNLPDHEAQAAFASTADGRKLYESYAKAMAPRGH